jgi:hypothetical protein
VLNVASQAGVAAGDARLLTSQLGAPDSRLELELSFDGLADMEAFFAALPVAEHVAWGARFAPVVCDGSPTWHVLRTVNLVAAAGGDPSAAAAPQQATPALPPAPAPAPTAVRRTESGLFVTGSEPFAAPAPSDAVEELDWKGDPVKWAPGDKKPKFAP